MAPAQQSQQATPMSPSQGGVITMSSLDLVEYINAHRKELAEAAGSAFPSKGHAKLEHSDFLTKVLVVLGACAGNFSATYPVPGPNGGTRAASCYRFPKREACLMAMSYSFELQAKVFDRMTALEQRSAGAPALPNFANPAEAARAWADQFEQRAVLEHKVAQDAPKVAAHDRIAAAGGDLCIRAAAKCLKLPERKFANWLVENGWAHRHGGGRRLTGYAEKERAGLVRHRVKTIERSSGEHEAVSQLLFTPKGMIALAREIIESERARESVPRPADLFSAASADRP